MQTNVLKKEPGKVENDMQIDYYCCSLAKLLGKGIPLQRQLCLVSKCLGGNSFNTQLKEHNFSNLQIYNCDVGFHYVSCNQR